MVLSESRVSVIEFKILFYFFYDSAIAYLSNKISARTSIFQ